MFFCKRGDDQLATHLTVTTLSTKPVEVTCIEIQCQVSRVLRPIHGRGKFSNLSVVAGDILTAIDGKDVAGFPKNVLRHYLLGPVIVAVCG